MRRDGPATERHEAIVGEAGIAAPLFGNRGRVVGAIGVSGPVEHLLPDGPPATTVTAVKEVARGLSRELGGGRAATAPGRRPNLGRRNELHAPQALQAVPGGRTLAAGMSYARRRRSKQSPGGVDAQRGQPPSSRVRRVVALAASSLASS